MMDRSRRLPARLAGLVVLVVATTGCATFSKDGGFGQTQQVVRDRIGQDAWWLRDDESAAEAQRRIDELLSEPLTADAAVQVALMANPRLQAAYAGLVVAESDRVQAGRLPNPLFMLLHTFRGDDFKIERVLGIDIFALLTMRSRTAVEAQRFEAAKWRAAAHTIETAFAARRAFIEAVAADETARYAEQVVDSALASRDLAREMAGTGNWPALSLEREQLFYAEAVLQLARAREQAFRARERLVRALGLWGAQATITLPERLPDLPDAPADMVDLEQRALNERVDITVGRLDLDATAKALGLARGTRLINLLEFGPAQTHERGHPVHTGYELMIDVPIFDVGSARVRRAEALYTEKLLGLRETAITARSEVRETYVAYRTAYDIARHYRDEIVPIRQRISEEQLLRYNGMLISVFELLADARDQVASVSAYIKALERYWVATIDLQQAMVGPSREGGANAADHAEITSPARSKAH